MAKIQRLDPHVADLIAAGEVVERPASVIKELMENSIDAGATVLTAEIKDGGMSFIRVTDNGCGIPPDDAETAFLRHATSKLRDARGLEAISTLGFRGEALAAIASVARVELLTRERGAAEGFSLTLEGGKTVGRAPAGCPEGTTMIVRDLFFNTPARLKFMKTDRAEGASVSAAVVRCALSHPEVSVKYIKDGKEECHTPGDGRMDSCIYSIFGREFAAGLLEAKSDGDGASVSGYVSAPHAARGNRSYQFFFVNGRFVRSKTLQAALEQAYKNCLFTGRYPSCVLYVNVSPAAVDVNVHPTKTEVKFLYEKKVFDSVYYAALGALENETKKAEIILSPGTKKALSIEPTGKSSGGYKTMTAEQYRKSGAVSPERETYRPIRDSVKSAYTASPAVSIPAPRREPVSPARTEPPAPAKAVEPTPAKAEKTAESGAQPMIAEMPKTPDFRVIGEAMDTYIIVEQGSSLWLIDKHAAHERIHFDRLRASGCEPMTQTLIMPVICRAGREDTALLLENAELLTRFGLAVEAFGEDAVAMREIPSDMEPGDAEAAVGEICAILRHGGGDLTARTDAIMHTIACKAAIKAGSRSDISELTALARRVMSGEIRYCPHGRPVATELTKAQLDRAFKRA